jgi:hypothetical protein
MTAKEAFAMSTQAATVNLDRVYDAIASDARRGATSTVVAFNLLGENSAARGNAVRELERKGYTVKFVSDQRDGDSYTISWVPVSSAAANYQDR